MKKKTTKPALQSKFDGRILYSRQGNEEGRLIERANGEVIAWFGEDRNYLVSAETLMRWAKQAQVYERALKKQKKREEKKKSSRKSEPRRLNKGKK